MNKKRLLAVAMASALSAGMVASVTTPAFAADKPADTAAATAAAPSEAQATNKEAEKEFIKVSEDALQSIRDMHSTRLAIFNGLPDKAKTFVDAAQKNIDAASKEADKYALDTQQAKAKQNEESKAQPQGEDDYVPFDASLTVMNTFVPTPENAKHIAKANEHLHKGEKKKALEVLKLGNIDVAVTASLVPVKFAKAHIDDAAKLISEGKYYEANLALKAVDDAVVVETYGVDAVPKVKGEETKNKG